MSPIADDLSTTSSGWLTLVESDGVRSASRGLTERDFDSGSSVGRCVLGRGGRPRSRCGLPGVIKSADSLSAEPDDESESAEFVRKMAFVSAEKLGSMGRG